MSVEREDRTGFLTHTAIFLSIAVLPFFLLPKMSDTFCAHYASFINGVIVVMIFIPFIDNFREISKGDNVENALEIILFKLIPFEEDILLFCEDKKIFLSLFTWFIIGTISLVFKNWFFIGASFGGIWYIVLNAYFNGIVDYALLPFDVRFSIDSKNIDKKWFNWLRTLLFLIMCCVIFAETAYLARADNKTFLTVFSDIENPIASTFSYIGNSI